MALKVFRQGDVLFIPILRSDIPPASDIVKVRKIKSRLIRRGEHGGRHEIEPGGQAEQIEVQQGPTRRRFLSMIGAAAAGVLGAVGIVHGEHNRLDLPTRVPELPEHEGDYEIRVQRELEGSATRFVND